MATPTQSSLKQKVYKIIQDFNLSFTIIEIDEDQWKPIAGPYLTREEAEVDLRNIESEDK